MKRNTDQVTLEYEEYFDLLEKLEDLQSENMRLQARIETLEDRLDWMINFP